MEMVGGGKVSQILGITTTIASLDTNAGSVKSVKSVQLVSLRRKMNGDGWRGGGSKVSKYQKCPKYWKLQLL